MNAVMQSQELIFSNARTLDSNSGMTYGEQLLHNARHGIISQGDNLK